MHKHNLNVHINKLPLNMTTPLTSLLLFASLSPFGINCHKGEASLTTWRRMHVIVVSAEGVKERGELPKVLLELLLRLTYLLHAVISREIVKLTRQSSHVVLKTLLHVVESVHDGISDMILDVTAKFRVLSV
jgi:hypothetical protein